MIKAAGVIFLTVDKKALFLQRSDEGDCPGLWAFPCGKIEGDETPQEAAERECIEEIGQFPKGNLTQHARQITIDVDYTTYLMVIGKEFEPVLNGEHTAFTWAPIGSHPEPMHPGAEIALQKFNLDELGIARFMTDGRLSSPQWYENIALFDIRITGTGIAYRRKLDEFTFRDPNVYLNQEFLDRCNGLPVILEHPKTSTLNTKEFTNRVVGTTFVPYIKGDEVWAIVKIFDIPTAKIMEANQLSTSPAVVFRDQDVNTKLSMEDGTTLLIEGKPSLLDHIAICSLGVWDKGGDPTGINNGDTQMPTEKEVKEEVKSDAEDRKRADAEAGQKLDKILAHLDSVEKRMDAFEKEKADSAAKADNVSKIADAEKEKADAEEKAKKDAEEKEKVDAEEKEKEMKAKKDAEENYKRASREDAVRKDEEDTRKRIADLERRMPRQLADADYKAMADVQAKADSVYNFFGKSAPRFLNGETPDAYRRRLAAELQPYSKVWKGVDLYKIDQEAAFAPIEQQIYADAEEAGLHPSDLDEDTLREIVTRDGITGRNTITFAGQPKTWMRNFSHQRQSARFVPVNRNR